MCIRDRREIGLFFEVIHGKERGGAFAGGGREDGRVGESESVGIEKIAGGANDFCADTQNGSLALGAQPKMAVLHQEFDTVFFGSDGIRIGFGHALHDLDVRDVEFIAAGSALVGADLAFDDDARFLGEAFDSVENFGRDGILRDYSLDDAASVAELREEQLTAFAEVVKPSANGDGLALVGADLCDGADG